MADGTIGTVYVGNIAWKIREDTLTQLFESVTDVSSVRIIQHKDSGLSMGYGFVEVRGDNAVQRACTLNGCELAGRNITVEPVRNNSPRIEARRPNRRL